MTGKRNSDRHHNSHDPQANRKPAATQYFRPGTDAERSVDMIGVTASEVAEIESLGEYFHSKRRAWRHVRELLIPGA